MARKRGAKYPSDQRRWFRVESPQLADDTIDLSDAEFRAFILCLAWANETQAHEHDNWIYIARSRLTSVAPNRRGSVATSARVVRGLCAKQSWELREEGSRWSIQIRNYLQKQGYAPPEPRPSPDETPANTNTNTTTTTTTSSARSSRRASPPPDWCFEATDRLEGLVLDRYSGFTKNNKRARSVGARIIEKISAERIQVEFAIDWLFGEANEGPYRIEVQAASGLHSKWGKIVSGIQRMKARNNNVPEQSKKTTTIKTAIAKALEKNDARHEGRDSAKDLVAGDAVRSLPERAVGE